jgi:hypothetical protein
LLNLVEPCGFMSYKISDTFASGHRSGCESSSNEGCWKTMSKPDHLGFAQVVGHDVRQA